MCKKILQFSISLVLAKYRHTGTIDRKKGSGRPVTARVINLRDMPLMIRAAWRWLWWVPRLLSCDSQSCSTSARFSSVIAVTGLPLPSLWSIVPVWWREEPDWCYGNSTFCLEIPLQSDYPSTSLSLFSETRGQEGQSVSPCQISWRWLKP